LSDLTDVNAISCVFYYFNGQINNNKMEFSQYAEKATIIVKEVAEELGFPEDKKLATRILRAVLHALRERLTMQESFQLLAQLPMLIKAVYVEGWHYSEKPHKIKSIGEFVKVVMHEDYPVGHHDIQTSKDGENAAMAVLKVIRNHVTEGEVRDMMAVMPEDLRSLWGEPVYS
jgi:uncharacterized protein (DUF2267 family)